MIVSILLRLAAGATATMLLFLTSSGIGVADPEDHSIRNGRFFTQTGGGGGRGYGVTDDNGVHFEAELERLGGPQAVGFPASHRFKWKGFTTQAFQRVVFQWHAETGQVQFVNVFDLAHDAGMDDFLFVVRQVPKAEQFNEAGLPFDEIVNRRLALLDDNPAIKAKYFSVVGDPIQMNGLPTSHVVDMGNHFALRAQRVLFQQWKQDTPWARAGDVTVALGGDIAKEIKLLPDDKALTSLTEQEFEVEREIEFEHGPEFEQEHEGERREDRRRD